MTIVLLKLMCKIHKKRLPT